MVMLCVGLIKVRDMNLLGDKSFFMGLMLGTKNDGFGSHVTVMHVCASSFPASLCPEVPILFPSLLFLKPIQFVVFTTSPFFANSYVRNPLLLY